jgi:hypothetical protein
VQGGYELECAEHVELDTTLLMLQKVEVVQLLSYLHGQWHECGNMNEKNKAPRAFSIT